VRVTFACALALAGCASAQTGESPDASRVDAAARPDAAHPDATPPDATPTDAMTIDATIEGRSFTDDAAGDFAGGVQNDVAIASFGALTPAAYYTGGWYELASDTGTFTDPASTTWATVAAFPQTGKAAISWWSGADWASTTPPSVGLTASDNWTELYQGDVYLEAGAWTFYLLVDDHGFVEIAPSGTTTYQRVVNASWSTEGSGAFTAPTTGWYPFRMAISNGGGASQFALKASGPTIGKSALSRHRMRARVEGEVGLVEAGFDDSHAVGDVETTIDKVTPGNTNWGTGNPGDLGMTAADTFSVRWAGQFRVDVGGAFVFQYQTDDGQRLWIDGTQYLSTWGDTTVTATTPSINLAPGFHDIVIDETENGGSAAAFLTVQSGPELAGAAIPLSRLRPIEARSERLAPGSQHTDVAIPDVTTVSAIAAVDGPIGATVTSVDVTYDLTHTHWSDLVITLIAPDGKQSVLFDHGTNFNGEQVQRATIAGTLLGAQVDGPWTLQVQDTVGADSGTLLDFAVTPHFAGGQPPIATTSSYESTVRDLGANVVSIGAIDWTERVPSGTDVAVRVRTCAASSDCASAAWSDPVTTPGGVPTVAPGEFVQYRVDFTSDGDHTPVLDAITLGYRVAI
jgi:subtilisin-like proprotein convertase family protein